MQTSKISATKTTRIAALLEREIADGVWAVSTYLPSEAELMARFDVSRHTVRAAVARLQHSGLVCGRQGVGTKVVRRVLEPEYTHSLESISELATYGRNTTVEVIRVEEIRLDADLAMQMGGHVGETWCHAVTLRSALGQGLPIGLTSVWVPATQRRVIESARKSGLPIFMELQKASGRMVSHVRQVLGAALCDKSQARLLGCGVHEPLLRIQRRYYASDERLLESSDSLHPPMRFQYAMTLRHKLAGAADSSHLTVS